MLKVTTLSELYKVVEDGEPGQLIVIPKELLKKLIKQEKGNNDKYKK
jgi:hypothetical protein